MAPIPAPDVRAEVRRLLSLALERPVAAAENPSRDADPAWDSLKHIEIVFLLEDHFGVRFTESDLARFENAEQIAGVVEARLAP